jgi:hypothetical protein
MTGEKAAPECRYRTGVNAAPECRYRTGEKLLQSAGIGQEQELQLRNC